jgi:hypothetical protein
MTLNFIHLKKELFEPDTPQYAEAVFREGNIQKQVTEQGITDFKIWDGIITSQIPFTGISRAFKRVVLDAKDKGLKHCAIAEDDMYFKSSKGWQYFLDNMPEDFDIYMGCAYKSIINKNNKIEFGFSGLTLICVHERFYTDFLSMKEMNNLDRELGRFAWKYKYMVCEPFVCHQHANFSFHQGKEIESYDYLLEGRQLYNG